MKYYKTNQQLKVCFTAQELACLILSEDLSAIIKIARNNLQNLDGAKILTNKLAQKSANSKVHEYFVAIFDLYELFNNDCQFCFNLNDRFNQASNNIITLDDLEKYKEDPPDVVIYFQKNFYDFELKRCREELSVKSLLDFIKKKIITHYSDHNCNYFIILQQITNSALNLDIFKKLHKKLNKLKRNLGKIAFSLNNNKKEMLLINVFPKLTISKRPFVPGSEYLKKILLGTKQSL
jgi:hypothetical protein